ncbi:hypothetical protein CHU32_25025 [Superficieibacter electus]|uniref:Uncharacterized protein n=1 Tax=Superficieibacter electus TaxID=2022662 RepID=A0A2P5GI11_9ENTR|nr:hypothetical protein CHU32_25025 [Superficieibacter electus]POP47970.1 hypothetical protein CHU33_02180 [Superficieibacter electus]
MIKITFKNDLKQKSRSLVMTKRGNFASGIAFLRSYSKKFRNILATYYLVRPILSSLVCFLCRITDPTLRTSLHHVTFLNKNNAMRLWS